MVLIGPIIIALTIIAVVLMVVLLLGVSGIRPKPPVPTAGRRAGPGSARIAGR
jgi:hypothetical protein